MNNAPLGVFDSGIGGLTVARALFERLPQESVIYFGDTARVPYGPKSPDTVRRYSAEILAYLLQRGVKAVVVACNTSTAHALGYLQERSSVPVVGVIEPGARAAARTTKTGTIGVIGTAGTIVASWCPTTSRIFVKWALCSWERSSSRSRWCRCELFQLDVVAVDHGVPPAIQKRAGIHIHASIGQPIHDRPMRVRHDDELHLGMPVQEIGRPLPLGDGGAIEHRPILRVVGEMAREHVCDPEADRGVQHAKHRHRDRVTQHAVHQRAAPVLLGQSVPVDNEGAPAVQVQLGFAAEEGDAQIPCEKRAAPPIVVAADERDWNAAGADLLELGDGGEMLAGNDAVILEPEVEEIAGQHQVIAGLGHLLQKGVKRRPDGGRHLTEMGVRYDNHARHGPSLGIWNGARKRITVLL